jgi:hypothetical protein
MARGEPLQRKPPHRRKTKEKGRTCPCNQNRKPRKIKRTKGTAEEGRERKAGERSESEGDGREL